MSKYTESTEMNVKLCKYPQSLDHDLDQNIEICSFW